MALFCLFIIGILLFHKFIEIEILKVKKSTKSHKSQHNDLTFRSDEEIPGL